MELSTAQEILVMILAVTLAVLLVLAIVIAVMILKLLQTLRLITAKAEKVIESAESIGQVFKSASGPMAIFKFVKNVVDTVQQHKAKHKE